MFYALTALIAFAAAFGIMHLWQMRLNVPLYYSNGGDELISIAWVKAMIDDGWYETITHLGAPIGMSFGDFPVGALLHMSILRAITFVIHDAGVALNLYFLAGFSLIAVGAAYVLRRLGISWPTALMISIVYSLLPTRFLRNESHLVYAQYYLVPLLVLCIVWIFRNHELFLTSTRRPTRDGYIFLIGLFAVAWDNQYNAVFGMSFLTLAGIASVVRTRTWRGALAAGVGVVVLFVSLELEILPNTLYVMQHGKNPIAIVRPPQSSEVYALTFAQLVLPIQGHRIPKLAEARSYFDSGIPTLVNENSSATLGILGALGFVGSLFALLLFRAKKNADLWPDLARLNVAAFLLATIGGVGALISYYFVRDLRGYNRISTLIAFVSLVTVAIALDAIRRKWVTRPGFDGPWYVAITLIGVLGIADQTSVGNRPPYIADIQTYNQDGTFAAMLEGRLPANAALYQTPHVTFPEAPPVVELGSWDQTALYLHSRTLRYSFGVTRGREAGAWQLRTDALPARQFLEQLILGGFDGILVYRSGYEDRGAAEEAALESQLGEAPVVRGDGLIVFFDLSKMRASYVAKIGEPITTRLSRAVMRGEPDPSLGAATKQIDELLEAAGGAPANISLTFGNGCYGSESSGIRTWHWCGNSGELTLTNDSAHSRVVELQYYLTTGQPAAVSATVNGVARTFQGLPSGTFIKEAIVVAPGRNVLRFSSNAKPIALPTDPRRLVIQIANLRYSVEPQAKPAPK